MNTMPDAALRRFPNTDEMFDTLSVEIVSRLTDGVAKNGKASFVTSGGTTPGGLYDLLSTRDAPWQNIYVTLSDERWISPSDDGSNEKLIRTRLLQNKAAAAHLVPMKTADASPDSGETRVSAAIQAMPRPFDVTLLGMGEDGHTASLFPNAKGLDLALNLDDPALARAVHTHNVAKTGERISLTLRAILDSRWIVILIKGEAKLDAYRMALSGTDPHDAPVRAVLRQSKAPVQVYWSP